MRHASAAFRFDHPFALTVTGNKLAFWSHARLGLRLTPGMNEVALAFVADAWSPTYRSSVTTYRSTGGAIRIPNGAFVLPDQVADSWPTEQPTGLSPRTAAVLDRALAGISARYGALIALVVAMQLVDPGGVPSCRPRRLAYARPASARPVADRKSPPSGRWCAAPVPDPKHLSFSR